MARAGKFRHRIRIYSPTIAQNNFGESTTTWTVLAFTRWASVSPLSGNKALIARQVAASSTHSIKLRYVDGLSVKHRIHWDDRVFDINAVLNIDERDREMELICTEAVPVVS